MPRKAANYQNGIQYKIVCKDPAITDCYNGSCCSLKDRKKNHKSKSCNPSDKSYNLKVYRFIREHGGWDNWTFIQLEVFSCNSKQELVAREREIFDILKPTLNTNSPTLNVEKRKRTMAKYAEEHKVEIADYKKQYYDENKVELVSKQKQYYDEHKDEFASKHKQYYDQHKVEIKQYYEENKVELAAKRKQKVKCVCGCDVAKYDLNKHMKTAKHMCAMAQLANKI